MHTITRHSDFGTYDLAYFRHHGSEPVVIFLGGFHSDMQGSKALHLDAWAKAKKNAFVRFDYFGHGQSGGDFAKGTIGQWRDDVLAVLDMVAPQPCVLVGSSMGGWLALLAALARPELVKGLVLLAPAPDFTEDLMWQSFSQQVRDTIVQQGHWLRPSAYGEDPYPITRALIEDGRRHLLLGGDIAFDGPVHILHGQEDADVPWQRSLTLAQRLTSRDVTLEFIKAGDHRLSDAGALARLVLAVETILATLTKA